MKSKLAYVAGPYSARTKLGVLLNIRRAWKVAKILWGNGYTVICPHSNSAFMENISNDEFIQRDLSLVGRCDVIFVLPGWQKSKGTREEIRYAGLLGKDIIMLGDISDARGFTEGIS